MTLSAEDVVPYLGTHHLPGISPKAAPTFEVIDVSRRNRNFKAIRQDGPSYLLKQAFDEEHVPGVAREAAAYRALQADKGFARYLPRMHRFDSQDGVLIIECLQDVQDLRAYHDRLGRFPRGLAASLGQALATLHQVPLPFEPAARDAFSPRQPLAFALTRPTLRLYADMSAANRQLIGILQSFAEFEAHLDALRDEWRADSFIHCDFRWDNCLVSKHGANRLKIIDWEFGGPGDACWDVGAMLSNYLSFWVLSIPIGGDVPPEELPALARHPLTKMQPAINAFWRSYVARMGLDPATANEWLLRASSYSAARLIETAYTQMQSSLQLSSHAACLLQLSLNILRSPEEALAHLFGIPLMQGSAP